MISKKTTVKITQINLFNSNANVFGWSGSNDTCHFHIDFDYDARILKAKEKGLIQFKKAIIRCLRERHDNIRFICPKHLI